MTSRTPSPYRACDEPGRCIYCDSTDPPLTDEHIIAKGMGWNTYIPKGSCKRCQRTTGGFNGFEGVVQRQMLRPLRVALGLHSRGKGDKDEEIDVEVVGADGGGKSDRLAPSSIPISAILPEFSPPLLLLSGPHDISTITAHVHYYGTPAATEQFKTLGHTGQTVTYDQGAFARMIAKIAHCGAVCRFGAGGFNPFLKEIILNSKAEWPFFIGCTTNAPPATGALHQIVVEQRVFPGGTGELIVVRIRLFTPLGTPTYEVITGWLPEAP